MINNKIHINESTSTSSGGRGSYIAPLQSGLRPFKKDALAPFTDSVSDYDSPLLQYDSYDGKMDERRKQIKQIEKTARKVTDYIKRHPYSTFSDDDGNNINQFPKGKNKLGIVPVNEWIEINDDLIVENLLKLPSTTITSAAKKKTSQNESFEVRIKNYLIEFVNNRKF
jgi:deoxycytidine triphosphate deaminase